MTAIVDSAIGGKTGINYKGIINSLALITIQEMFLYLKILFHQFLKENIPLVLLRLLNVD